MDSDTELLVRANEPRSATVISLCIAVGKSGSVLALRPSLDISVSLRVVDVLCEEVYLLQLSGECV